jgi:hypothetical protein
MKLKTRSIFKRSIHIPIYMPITLDRMWCGPEYPRVMFMTNAMRHPNHVPNAVRWNAVVWWISLAKRLALRRFSKTI